MATLRDYHDGDLARCMDLMDQAWDVDRLMGAPDLGLFVKEFYVVGSLAESRHFRVVEDDGRVLGLLFGKCGPGRVYKTDYKGVVGKLRLAGRFFRLSGLDFRRKLEWLRVMRRHEANRKRLSPQSDAEVMLLAVDGNARGRGLGRLLMDDYVDVCRSLDKPRITVETDIHSNFGFYEHYGFVLAGDFNSPMNELFTGGSGESYVYVLDL